MKALALLHPIVAVAFLAPLGAAQCDWGATDQITPGSFVDPLLHFGLSLALDGDLAVSGAPGDEAEDAVGKAYVFRRLENAWLVEAVLVPDDGALGDEFGASISLRDGVVVVGAPGYDHGMGKAYVFEAVHGDWFQTASFEPALATGSSAEAQFGRAVAVHHANHAVVGAPGWGRAYALEYAGGAWQLVQALQAASEADEFGFSLASDGERILVGAPKSNRAVLFRQGPAGWEEVVSLSSASVDGGDLGHAVALAGQVALVGAPDYGDEVGRVCVFDEYATAWTETAVLQPDSSQQALFGSALAIADERALIGAPAEDELLGSAYIFRRLAGEWISDAKLLPEVGTTEYSFGTAVALEADSAFVNVGLEEVPVIGQGASGYAGSVYVWTSNQSTCPDLTAYPSWVSVAAGGSQSLLLDAGADLPFHLYVLLGSTSGTAPGVDLGGAHLPLNYDSYFHVTLTSTNSGPFVSTFGLLSSQGKSTAQIQVPPGTLSQLAGLQMHHAFVVLHPATGAVIYASEPAPLSLLP